MKGRFLIFCVFIVLPIFASCSFGGNKSSLDELVQAADVGSIYRVSPGDTLAVEVWGEPKLSGNVYVRQDGKFSMPLVKDIEASGLTLDELSQEISSKLQQYIKSPSIAISVVLEAPTRYYLSGKFNKPGEFRSASKITLLQAIATGGGFAPFATTSSIILIRTFEAGEKRYELNYGSVIKGTEPNPILRDGDVIAVE